MIIITVVKRTWTDIDSCIFGIFIVKENFQNVVCLSLAPELRVYWMDSFILYHLLLETLVLWFM